MEILAQKRHSGAMSAETMVEKFVKSRKISDRRVLEVMSQIPRHLFVPQAFREQAYSDRPLPIGDDQTISQPYTVGLMTQALRLTGTEKVLEIGTGSGYQTAVLSRLCRSVFSVERIRKLANRARETLEQLGSHNVSIRVGDGALGWEEFAPFDRILITAAAPEVPKALFKQLEEGGRMVVPQVDSRNGQNLYAFVRRKEAVSREHVGRCSFVPFVLSS